MSWYVSLLSLLPATTYTDLWFGLCPKLVKQARLISGNLYDDRPWLYGAKL